MPDTVDTVIWAPDDGWNTTRNMLSNWQVQINCILLQMFGHYWPTLSYATHVNFWKKKLIFWKLIVLCWLSALYCTSSRVDEDGHRDIAECYWQGKPYVLGWKPVPVLFWKKKQNSRNSPGFNTGFPHWEVYHHLNYIPYLKTYLSVNTSLLDHKTSH